MTEVIVVIAFVFGAGFYQANQEKKKMDLEINKIKNMSIEEKKLYIMKSQHKFEKLKTNHILHFLVCIFTAFLWVVPWVIIAKNNKKQRFALEKLIDLV